MMSSSTTRRMKRRYRWAASLLIDALVVSSALMGTMALIAVLALSLSRIRGGLF